MKAVFLDTVGLIAVWDTSDEWHPAAELAYRELLKQSRSLVTTEAVLLECGNAASRRPYRSRVAALRQLLMEEDLLVSLTQAEVNEAWGVYSQQEPGGPGIVDCLSFAVMRRLGCREAFTNDRHFAAAGFTTLF